MKICLNFNLQVDVDQDVKNRLDKQREPCKKSPKWITEYFSERSESDDSEIEDDGGYDQDEDEDENDYYEDDEDGDPQADDDDMDEMN